MSRRRKILVVAGIALGVAILIPVIRHYQLKAAVNRYRAELKAKGEPMELSQVIPPTVPPEQDGTGLFLKAAPLISSDKTFLRTNPIPSMKMVAPGKAMSCAKQPEVRETGESGFTNSWEDVQAAVEQNAEALELLRQIIKRPQFDFHMRYEQGFYDTGFLTNIQHVVMKQSVMHLKSAAVSDLHQGNAEAAVDNVRASLALASAMERQRVEISELVRIAIVAVAQSATWEVLQATNLTDAELSALQADWMRMDFLQNHIDTLNMENIVEDIEVARWRDSNREMKKLIALYENAFNSLGGGNEEESTLLQKAKVSRQIFLWRYWWSYPDELRSLKGQEVLLEAAFEAKTNRAFLSVLEHQNRSLDELGFNKLDDAFSSILSGKLNFRSMLSESIMTVGKTLSKVMAAECSKHMTVTAIALKRYQLKYGNYPADLNSLVPEFISVVPLDPENGQPLCYRPNVDETFLLYSVGENGVDDGGNPSLEKGTTSSSLNWQNPHALDWVWPQPATAAEIQYFYDHPPK